MMDLLELAERCEAAIDCGHQDLRTLFYAAYAAIYPQDWMLGRSGFGRSGFAGNFLEFEELLKAHAYLDAALTLVPAGWEIGVRLELSGASKAYVSKPRPELNAGHFHYAGTAVTPALALCAASLRAIASQENPHD